MAIEGQDGWDEEAHRRAGSALLADALITYLRSHEAPKGKV